MIRSHQDVPGWRASLPFDVVTSVALVALLGFQLIGLRGVPRVVLGLVFVLFVPGYVLLAALFPSRAQQSETDSDPFPTVGLDWGERAALSVAASVSLVPLVGLAMAAAGAPFSAASMQAWLVVVTLVLAVAAAARRYTLPPEERLVVPLSAWTGGLYDRTLGASSRRDAALNVALAASVVLALGSVGYAVADAQQDDPYTGVSILTENEDGDLVAAGYETQYGQGDTHSYVVQVENHRPEQNQYTVLTELQRVRVADDGTVRVLESERLAERSVDVASYAARNVSVSAMPTLAGEDLRLMTYVYRGDAPDDPSEATAEEHVFLWVSVEPNNPEAGGNNSTSGGAGNTTTATTTTTPEGNATTETATTETATQTGTTQTSTATTETPTATQTTTAEPTTTEATATTTTADEAVSTTPSETTASQLTTTQTTPGDGADEGTGDNVEEGDGEDDNGSNGGDDGSDGNDDGDDGNDDDSADDD